MKKLGALLFLFFLLASGSPAYAEGLTAFSNDGDKVSILGDLKIDSKTDGDIVVILGNLDIQGDVDGDVVLVIGDATINARVSGQVVNVLGSLKLDEKAVVEGDVIVVGGYERLPGARISGDVNVVRGYGLNIGIGFILVARVFSIIVFAVLVLLLGIILLSFSRDKYLAMIEGAELETGRKLAIGFLGFLGATIIAVLLFITLIVPLLYFILLLVAGAVSSLYFGRIILRPFVSNCSPFLELLAGVTAITAVKLGILYSIPLHEFVTGNLLVLLFGVFVNSMGMGLFLSSRFEKSRLEKAKS